MDGADLLARILTRARYKVSVLFILFTADAVVTLVLAGVDVTVVVQFLQEALHVFFVPWFGRANEVVVGDVDRLQQRQPGARYEPVGPFLGGYTVCGRGAQNLLAVLIGTGQHPRVIPGLSVPARQDIGGHLRVRMPDVWHIIDVEDGRGDIEGRAISHALNPMGATGIVECAHAGGRSMVCFMLWAIVSRSALTQGAVAPLVAQRGKHRQSANR